MAFNVLHHKQSI